MEKFLNLHGLSTVLSNLYTKYSEQFSPKSHKHSTDDLTGLIAISQGGTGGNSSSSARENLKATNVVSSATEPSTQIAGDIWLKEV